VALTSMFSSAAANADDALITEGTGNPTPTQDWIDAVISDYVNPATNGSYTGIAVTTPETLPLAPSLDTGLADLQAAMVQEQLAHPGQPYLIEGESQSAIITMLEGQQLAALAAAGQPIPDVTLVVIGSGNRPDGGLLERFPDLYIPGLEMQFNGAEATEGLAAVDIARQYDFFADFPQYPTNGLADVNALMGLDYVHSTYGNGETPLVGPFTDQYVDGSSEIVKQVTGETTFYFIPTEQLPLFDPLLEMGVPESVINIVQPAARVIIEAGYDRDISFGDPTSAQLIPVEDPFTFTLEFDKAVVEGANNAFALFGAQLPGATDLENLLASAGSWSAQEIGVPYGQVVSEINAAFDPFTTFSALEEPLGKSTEEFLMTTGIQQLLDPILASLATTTL
jgi:hypothetical protein